MRPGFFHLKVKGRTRKNRWKTISFRSKLHSFLAYTVASLTGHKVQGATLDAIIVGSWGHYKYGAQGWLNVILSRVRKLADLYILEKLPERPEFFKKRFEVEVENTRIKNLSTMTLDMIDGFLTE